MAQETDEETESEQEEEVEEDGPVVEEAVVQVTVVGDSQQGEQEEEAVQAVSTVPATLPEAGLAGINLTIEQVYG